MKTLELTDDEVKLLKGVLCDTKRNLSAVLDDPHETKEHHAAAAVALYMTSQIKEKLK